jgi:hypothetical protein
MITIDKDNVRIHPDGNKTAIKNSLSRLGAGRSILIDADDVLIAGNGVFEQAEALGIPVKVIETNGKELIAVKRTDLNADDEKRQALAIADNRLTDLSEFDAEALNKMLEDMSPDMQELAGYAIDPNNFLEDGEVVTDPSAEWNGMPEFEQDDNTSYRRMIVHFMNEDAVSKFGKKMEQTITGKTKYIWFPEQVNADLKSISYE